MDRLGNPSAAGSPKLVRYDIRSETTRIAHSLDLDQIASFQVLHQVSGSLDVNALCLILNDECNAFGIGFAHENALESHGNCATRLVLRQCAHLSGCGQRDLVRRKRSGTTKCAESETRWQHQREPGFGP
jgi:hypothetical protein